MLLWGLCDVSVALLLWRSVKKSRGGHGLSSPLHTSARLASRVLQLGAGTGVTTATALRVGGHATMRK